MICVLKKTNGCSPEYLQNVYPSAIDDTGADYKLHWGEALQMAYVFESTYENRFPQELQRALDQLLAKKEFIYAHNLVLIPVKIVELT